MEKLKLKVAPRTDMKKSHIKTLKANHKVPGNVYGLGKDSLAVEVELAELAGIMRTHHGAHSLIDLSIQGHKGRPELVVIRSLQKDPLTRRLQHVEFQRVSLKEAITTAVAITLSGHPRGVAEGGLLEQVMWEAHVKCLPDHIPDQLELEISQLEIGQHLSLGDIALPEGVELVGLPEDTVVTVRGRGGKGTELPEEAAAAAAAEEAAEATEEAQSES